MNWARVPLPATCRPELTFGIKGNAGEAGRIAMATVEWAALTAGAWTLSIAAAVSVLLPDRHPVVGT